MMNSVISLLPTSMQQVAAVIGLPAVVALIQHYPGLTVPIPRKQGFGLSVDLNKIIGQQATARLCAAYGNQTISIPRCASLISRLMAEDIHVSVQHLETHGNTTRQAVHTVARKWAITERAVWRILSRPSPSLPKNFKIDSGQLALF